MSPRLRIFIVAAGVALATSAVPAFAHEDPPGCNETGAAINVGIFRDANATIPLTGAVSPCEIIFYRAQLTTVTPQVPGDTVCAFSGGTFDFTTPDGNNTVVSSDVPCIGATVGSVAENCVAGVNSLTSPVIQYQVKPADVVGGHIVANSTYGIAGGISGVAHDGDPNTSGVTASTPKTTDVLSCDDNNACTTDVCDQPTLHGAAGCSHTAISCDDNNACTADGCDSATGCFHTDITGTCNDNDACTTDGCDPATGCTHTPIDCNDNDACTTDGCDPQTGCTHGAVSCNDNNLCTQDGCNPQTGCTHTDISANCNDEDVCTDDSCDPQTGCVHTPNNAPGCAGLDHFQCYEIKPFAFGRKTATVTDRYGTATVSIRMPDRLCAPSDKRGEDPTAPLDPEHLIAYPDIAGPVRILNQTIENQFGRVTVNLIRRSFLLVPALKSLQSSPPAPESPVTDHFQCYLVKRASGTTRFAPIPGLPAVDQFGSHAMDLLRPRYFCTPASKNDENPDAPSHTASLLCYKARHRVRFGTQKPFTNDQFGPLHEAITRRLEFCVPSTLVVNGD